MKPEAILAVINELATLDAEALAVVSKLIEAGQTLPAPLDKLTPYLAEVQTGLKVFQVLVGLAAKIEAVLAALPPA